MRDAWALSEDDGIASYASVRAVRAVQDAGIGANTAESWHKHPYWQERVKSHLHQLLSKFVGVHSA